MLRRKEILNILKKLGIRKASELKAECRDYEKYFRGAFKNILLPSGSN